MWMNYLLLAGAGTIVALLLRLLSLVLLQGRRLYHPTRELEALPSDLGLPYENVFLTTSDNVSLHGWFIPADQACTNVLTLLMCHGNGGNISHRLDSFAVYHSLGLSVLAFDYRGYGQSAGSPSERGMYLDAAAAWDFLIHQRRCSTSKTIILGRSLGGAVAAQLASTASPAGLVIESAFTSVKDLAAEYHPLLPARRLCRFEYSTIKYIQQVRCPVLLLHSRQDQTVPFAHAQRLLNAAPNDKKLIELTGSHNDAHRAAAYAIALREFCAQCPKFKAGS